MKPVEKLRAHSAEFAKKVFSVCDDVHTAVGNQLLICCEYLMVNFLQIILFVAHKQQHKLKTIQYF